MDSPNVLFNESLKQSTKKKEKKNQLSLPEDTVLDPLLAYLRTRILFRCAISLEMVRNLSFLPRKLYPDLQFQQSSHGTLCLKHIRDRIIFSLTLDY